MDNAVLHASTILEAWREQGADRIDPVRFRFIEAMARRASGHGGEVRRILDEKIARLIEEYGGELDSPRMEKDGRADDRQGKAGPHARLGQGSSRGPLGELVDEISTRARAEGKGDGHGEGPYRAAERDAASPPADMLHYLQEIWSKVSVERQLRESFELVPDHAGPLNSSSLVHRSLTLMQTLCPDYLQQFLSYVEALSWLDELCGGIAPLKDAPRPPGGKRAVRGKSR